MDDCPHESTIIRRLNAEAFLSQIYSETKAVPQFAEAMRRGKILCSRCCRCGLQMVPAIQSCEDCNYDAVDLVVACDTGEVISLTEEKGVHYAIIKIEGVYNTIVHRIRPNGKPVKVGSLVRAVFKPETERVGSILDIRHFEAY